MDRFWDALESSALTQWLLTIGMFSVLAAMYLTGRTVPDDLSKAFLMVLVFWFGSKSQAGINAAIKSLKRKG